MTGVPTLMTNPFDEAFLADPYAHHDALRDAGPVVWLDSIGLECAQRNDAIHQCARSMQSAIWPRPMRCWSFLTPSGCARRDASTC